VGSLTTVRLNFYVEFWKHIPPNEPFRVLLGDMRDKLYNTRERMRLMLANGKSDINLEDTFTDASQVCIFFSTVGFKLCPNCHLGVDTKSSMLSLFPISTLG